MLAPSRTNSGETETESLNATEVVGTEGDVSAGIDSTTMTLGNSMVGNRMTSLAAASGTSSTSATSTLLATSTTV